MPCRHRLAATRRLLRRPSLPFVAGALLARDLARRARRGAPPAPPPPPPLRPPRLPHVARARRPRRARLPAWSKWPSGRGHSWTPRARRTASEGFGLLLALVRRGPASQIPPGGLVPGATLRLTMQVSSFLIPSDAAVAGSARRLFGWAALCTPLVAVRRAMPRQTDASNPGSSHPSRFVHSAIILTRCARHAGTHSPTRCARRCCWAPAARTSTSRS